MPSLDYLGMLTLGIFVGSLLTYGLQFIKDFNTFSKALTILLGAALSGTVMLFIDKLNSGRALGAYCVGLVVALMWAYASIALKNVKSKNPSLIILGWLHITAAVLVSVAAAALFLPPAYREMSSVGVPPQAAPTTKSQ